VPVRVEQPIIWRTEAAPAAAAPAPGPPDSIHVYALEDADVRPMPRNFGDFETALRELYPRELRDVRPPAEVLVRFVVDPSGHVQYPHVPRSSDARFDSVSVQAVRRLRFQPARRQGVPVWVRMEVPIAWSEVRPVSAADSDGTYDLRDVDSSPRLLDVREFRRRLEELYPVTLRAAGESGIVEVRFRIEVDGTTSNHIITHSTNDKFNDATLRAVRTAIFRPAVLDRRPVPVWVHLPIHWTMALDFEEPLFSIPDGPILDTPPSRPDRRP
ncbi:MAG TPA: energy transducer TonB, partial [Longimicrobium sp.]|nr:energy transducer TonB [Longimicrobium sp.]